MNKFVEIETAPGEYIEKAWINPEEISSISSNTLGSDTLITTVSYTHLTLPTTHYL